MQLSTMRYPKALIGLGNPGTAYAKTRHNIGFMVLEALAQAYNVSWHEKEHIAIAHITINGTPVLLVKPLTFMNKSGDIVPFLAKQGIKANDVVVIHDELEMPLGKLALRDGGSARGHNGLRSLINRWGQDFTRLRFGIGRPEHKEDVPTYVLQNFPNEEEVNQLIDRSLVILENLYKT